MRDTSIFPVFGMTTMSTGKLTTPGAMPKPAPCVMVSRAASVNIAGADRIDASEQDPPNSADSLCTSGF